jgi:hypothetical protein
MDFGDLLQRSHFFVNSFLDSKHLKDLITNSLDFMLCIPTLDIAHALSSIFQAVRFYLSLSDQVLCYFTQAKQRLTEFKFVLISNRKA